MRFCVVSGKIIIVVITYYTVIKNWKCIFDFVRVDVDCQEQSSVYPGIYSTCDVCVSSFKWTKRKHLQD